MRSLADLEVELARVWNDHEADKVTSITLEGGELFDTPTNSGVYLGKSAMYRLVQHRDGQPNMTIPVLDVGKATFNSLIVEAELKPLMDVATTVLREWRYQYGEISLEQYMEDRI